jgi:hypothetical protein
MDRRYLRPADLVLRYNGAVGEKTLANWRVTGRGPRFTKVGGKIFYSLEEVAKWEEKNTNRSTSEYAAAAVFAGLLGLEHLAPFMVLI